MSDLKVITSPVLQDDPNVAKLFWEENGERIPFYYMQGSQMFCICYDVFSIDMNFNTRMQMLMANSSQDLQEKHKEVMSVGRKFFTENANTKL
jgi:hypothetical protein